MSRNTNPNKGEVRQDRAEWIDNGFWGVDPRHRNHAQLADISSGDVDASVAWQRADTFAQQFSLALTPTPGTYRFDSNITITSHVEIISGVILKPAAGVTVTLPGSFIIPQFTYTDLSLGGTVTGGTSGVGGGTPDWDDIDFAGSTVADIEDWPADAPGNLVNDGAGGLSWVPGGGGGSLGLVLLSDYASLHVAITSIGATPVTLLIDEDTTLTQNATIPSTLGVRVLVPGNLITLGAFDLDINGPVEAPRFKWINENSTGEAQFNPGSAETVYAEWFGAVGDGVTDDLVPCRRAVEEAQRARALCIQDRKYGLSDTLTFPTGDGISFTMSRFHQNIEGADTGFIPLVGFAGTAVVEIQEITRPWFGTLSVNNRVNDIANLTGVLMHNSADGQTLGGKGRFERIAVSGCDIGLQVGDTTGDGWDSNIEGFHVELLAGYEVGKILKMDSDAIDLITFGRIELSGVGTGTRFEAESVDHVIEILKAGNAVNLGRIFLNADAIIEDNAVVYCEAGVSWETLSIEGGTTACRAFDIVGDNGGRELIEIGNVFTVAEQCVDTAGLSAIIDYGPGTFLRRGQFTGDVRIDEFVLTGIVSFITGGAFILNGANAYHVGLAQGSRATTSTRTTPDESSDPELVADEIKSIERHLERTDGARVVFAEKVKEEASANIANGSAYDIATVSIPDSTGVGIAVDYYLYEASSTQVVNCRGRIYYNAIADNTGVISIAATLADTPGKVLDAYASFVVAASMTKDEGANTVTLQLTQTNDLAAACRGVFRITMMAHSSTSAALADLDIITI